MLEKLREFIREKGYDFDPIIDGTVHNIKTEKSKIWMVGNEFVTGSGKTCFDFHFGDWKSGNESHKFSSKDFDKSLTPEEKKELAQKQKQYEALIKEQKEKDQDAAFKKCTREWEKFSEVFRQTSYMKKKEIRSLHGARLDDVSSVNLPTLIVPCRDIDGKLWGYQSISDTGDKAFQDGQRIDGLFHLIGSPTGVLYICEGFATGTSIYEAVKHIEGRAVAVAFNANNLVKASVNLRRLYPNIPIVVCADDDRYNSENVGVKKAGEAAEKCLGTVLLPKFKSYESRPTDWNDLFVLEGKDVVFSQISSHKVEEPCDIISSEKDGFWLHDGKKSFPDYKGLRKFLSREHRYKVLDESGVCFVWDGKKYTEFVEKRIENFAEMYFGVETKQYMRGEFKNLVLCTNLVPWGWFNETTENKLNFENGVLDLETMELMPHSPAFGFRHILKYNYDKNALCPIFDRFLDDITQGDSELKLCLLEYMGYALSNDECWVGDQGSLILTGEGANGKSTFINILKGLAGQGNYTTYKLTELEKETNLQRLDGALFNIAAEAPTKGLMDSATYKALSTGDEVEVRELFKKGYTMRNKAKLIFACNALPETGDTSDAFFRRLLIIPFNETFSTKKGNKDSFIESKLLKEKAGIFNKVIEAYKTLKARGHFLYPEKSKKALDKFRKDSDPILQWFQDTVEVHPLGNGHDNVACSISQLYSNFRREQEQGGRRNIDPVHIFGRKLRKLIPDHDDRADLQRVEGKVSRVLKAVKFNSGDNS